MKRICYLILVLVCFQSGTALKRDVYFQNAVSLPPLMDSLKVEKEDLWILVDKSDYKLALMAGEEVVKEYPVVFGGNPVDDKLMEGDQCTPEGSFKIRDLYPHKNWSKFIWIDYPNADSWEKHQKAKEAGEIPEDAKIGGEIGIHGVPEGYDHAIANKMNWTLGCISMTNKEVDELYAQLHKGMVVKIRK